MNISTNLKAIDMIKGEILSEIAHLYRTLADYDEIGDYESVTNEIATVIAMDYILARRLGIGYANKDKKISAAKAYSALMHFGGTYEKTLRTSC